MRNKKILFISVLLFMVVLSIGAISAQDVADDAIVSNSTTVGFDDSGLNIDESNAVSDDSNTVSGNVGVFTENPWNTTGELSFDIPSDTKTIKSADVYVNVYSGNAANTYGANANITITTDNNNVTHFESLWIEEGSTDGTVYTVNDHTTKCYSDYMIHYDISSMLDGLNGTNLKINVDTFQMEGKQFDGRIKLIALVFAYDDYDDDVINYWINDDQLWTKSNVTITFDTSNVTEFNSAVLANVVLSSGDGTYVLNDEFLGDADVHYSGNYYQFNAWNVTDVVKTNQKTDLNVIYAGTSAWGSIKNVLSVLATANILPLSTEISVTPEYTSVPSAYAGTNNTLTVKVKTSKAGKYGIKLLADGVEVDDASVDFAEGDNTVLLTDPTIRPVDASTVNGAENSVVNYTVELYYKGDAVDNREISLPVLYNGNLGSDYEYNITGFEEIGPITVTGDFIIYVQDESSYLGASAMNRTDVWEIYSYDDSTITNAYIYVPYNWFNAKTYTEDINMFNVTFNGVSITPIAWYRDQGNLGNYGKYGYGVFVYDVSDLIAVGDNEFVLNKANPTPAVYPSVLVFMYNTTGSLYSTTVSILNGADLLSNANNNAGRIVSADTVFSADPDSISGAILYVLAAGAQAGESDIVFNGEVYSDVWTGSSSSTNLFFEGIGSLINESNSISFVATGSTILALPQFIVTTTYVGPKTELSIAPEYTSVPCAYAGTNNTVTVKVKTSETANYTVVLYVDGLFADSVDVVLVEGDNTILLTDPTIRPVDASTVNGAENNMVEYYVDVVYNGVIIDSEEMLLPVLYNGNLGSDYEYNITGFEEIAPITVTGDFVIDVQDVSSYLGASAMNRTDVWEIDLDNDSTITNAYVYVPYNWFNAKTYTEGIDMFTATFNGYAVTPVAWYRDQGNLGNYGKYGYGVFVYDVSDLISVGDNEFVLNKANPTPAVYPSVLVYMYNTTGSTVAKTIYALNGADLLSNANNNAGRIVKADTEMNINYNILDNATLYVLAASAQVGESDIVFNGEVYSNVWSGTSSTTDLFSADVTSFIKDSNSISFVATGSTILELSQFIVTFKDTSTTLSADDVVAVYKDDAGELVATLTNVKGKGLNSANVVVSLGGVDYALKTNSKGQVRVSTSGLVPGNYTATISYAGSSKYDPSSTTANVVVVKADTSICAPDVAVSYRDESGELVVTLTNEYGNPLNSANVVVNLNGVDYALKTNSKGQVKVSTSDLSIKTYVATISYAGSGKYNPTNTTANVVVKADTCIIAPDANVVYLDESGELVATLINAVSERTINGVTLIVSLNGVDYRVKTDSNGQVRVSTANLTAKTYTATISFGGTSRYNPSSTTAKVIVGKADAVILADDVNVVYKDGSSEFVATLTNTHGTPLKYVNVVVNLNGVDYTLKTNSNGQVKVSTADLAPKTYVAVVSYAGNTKYNPTVATANVVVNKAATSISAVDNGEELVATLTNEYGTALNSANVKVTVNGVKYALKTNSKGQVKVSTADLDSKDYTATVSYAGNAKYNSASTTIKAAEGKTTTSIYTAYNKETGELITTLTNAATGNGIKGAKVVVNINGVKNSLTTDSNGQVIVSTVEFNPNTYVIASSYAGNTKYTATSTTETIFITN